MKIPLFHVDEIEGFFHCVFIAEFKESPIKLLKSLINIRKSLINFKCPMQTKPHK